MHWDPHELAGIRILVVEDDEDMAESLADFLSLLGAIVSIARDGLVALELVHTFQPNVILLDLGLPGLDGYAVAARVRVQEALESRPAVIAVTGYGASDVQAHIAAEGFFACLVKPVAAEELVRVIHASRAN
jgi:CheY-like chemotaxis protein